MLVTTNSHYFYSIARALDAYQNAHYSSMDERVSRVEKCFDQVRHLRARQDELFETDAQFRIKESRFWWTSHGIAALVTAGVAIASFPPVLALSAGTATYAAAVGSALWTSALAALPVGSTAYATAQSATATYHKSLFDPISASQIDLAGRITCITDEAREAEAKTGFYSRLFDEMIKTISRSVTAAT